MAISKGLAASALIYASAMSEVVLIRRNNPPHQALFAPPGGKVEPGETLQEAVIREIKEEISIDLILPTPYNIVTVQEEDKYIISVFLGFIKDEQTPDR